MQYHQSLHQNPFYGFLPRLPPCIKTRYFPLLKYFSHTLPNPLESPQTKSPINELKKNLSSLKKKDSLTMKFIILLLLVLLVTVFGAPLDSTPTEILPSADSPKADDSRIVVLCDTTLASPLTGHILAAATRLFNRTGVCLQENSHGSRCSMLVKTSTAAIGFCGRSGMAVGCGAAGTMVLEVVSQCAHLFPDGTHRVGGRAVWGKEASRIILYNTAG